jgi:hypothetical protein
LWRTADSSRAFRRVDGFSPVLGHVDFSKPQHQIRVDLAPRARWWRGEVSQVNIKQGRIICKQRNSAFLPDALGAGNQLIGAHQD